MGIIKITALKNLKQSFMATAQIKMYELLKGKIGEKEAETFIQLIDEKMDAKIDQRKNELATKEDVWSLKMSTKEDISALKAELLRTMYVTTVGQLIAIIASVVSLMLVLRK